LAKFCQEKFSLLDNLFVVIMTFGEKLREFCINRWGSLKEAAKELGIHQPNLSDYINDKSEPRSSFIAKLLNAGCDINWLLHDDLAKGLAINESGSEYITNEVAYLNNQIEKMQNEIKFLRGVLSAIKIQVETADKESEINVPIKHLPK